jgi:hypothetical protein
MTLQDLETQLLSLAPAEKLQIIQILAQSLINTQTSEEEQSLLEDPAWIETTRQKVDAAIQSLEANGGKDGETVVHQLLDRFRQARISQP